MSDALQKPVVRYVDAIPFEEDGQTLFYLHDPQEIAASPLVLSPAELYLLSLFDGQHTLRDVQLAFATQFNGALIPESHIRKLIDILEENFYLNTPRFHEHYRQLRESFAAATVRKAWHAGTAYPDNPEELRAKLHSFYTQTGGAGWPLLSAQTEPREVAAIMAPHIDLRVGGACYTHAYKALMADTTPADLYIILGVAHYGGGSFFTATKKSFETPLGIVPTDKAFIERWSEKAGIDFTENEWAHRTEHSIEFQLPFMQHLFNHDYQIVPILCGSPIPYLSQGLHLNEVPEIRRAIAALGEMIAADSRKIQLILSVDLAHMGPKFDDPFPITPQKAAEIRRSDEQMFEALAEMDGKRFYHLMVNDLLKRNVDACSAIYTMLQLMPTGVAKQVGYDQNLQPDTQSIVTYGSMVFYGKIG